ncbi:MAG: EamA family transporter RarD [Campylobacteraceae bacterium]|nr:EamA family transporter RarD [Campylobacteraceae bacterium]
MNNLSANTRHGIFYAIGAFGFWGLAPIYFKTLDSVLASEILMHRIVWSVVFLFFILASSRQLRTLRAIFSSPKTLSWLILSSSLIAANWGVYIWAVNHNMIIEASLGYYINPLVTIFLGSVFLGERPTRFQYIAIFLAFLAVVYQVITLGSLPIISLSLALLFGFYGLVRKRISIPSLPGLYVETLLLAPVALIYWAFLLYQHQSTFTFGANISWLLILAGPVTVIPLLAFNSATVRLRLSTIGYFQYLAPTITLFLAVSIYNEPLTQEKLITFSLIWTALVLVSLESYFKRKNLQKGK